MRIVLNSKLLAKLLFILVISLPNIALSEERNSQLHALIGLTSASFSGPTSGSFTIPMSLAFEYEYIVDSNKSYLFENVLALDTVDTKTKYFATRFGTRYYFWSSNLNTSKSDEKGNFSITPKLRIYAGWNVGVAQVVVRSLGTVLDAVSTVLEYGGHAGSVYQMGKNWGIEAKFGLAMGFGFSSVAVSSTAIQLMFGGAYYY